VAEEAELELVVTDDCSEVELDVEDIEDEEVDVAEEIEVEDELVELVLEVVDVEVEDPPNLVAAIPPATRITMTTITTTIVVVLLIALLSFDLLSNTQSDNLTLY